MTRESATPVSRSDGDIFVRARKALDDRHSVPQSVRVHVDQGVITLTGTVRWPFERTAAEETVREIDGVQRVVNNITVAHMPNKEGYEAPA